MNEWNRGDTIVLQEVWDGRLWTARPMIVVQDLTDCLILWKPYRTTYQRPRPKQDNPGQPLAERVARCMEYGDWVLEPGMWDASTLWFLYPNRYYSIWMSWRASGARWGWYVNFQRPFSRGLNRIQTMDLSLDITIDLDLAWNWKDRDEFELLVERSLISSTEEAAVKSASTEVFDLLGRQAEPFDGVWEDWKPDPKWGIPELPFDWRSLAKWL